MLQFSLLELQNFFKSLHGGAFAAAVELVAIACARTVVAEDKELFLGEISLAYLSGASKNVSSVGLICYLFILMYCR